MRKYVVISLLVLISIFVFSEYFGSWYVSDGMIQMPEWETYVYVMYNTPISNTLPLKLGIMFDILRNTVILLFSDTSLNYMFLNGSSINVYVHNGGKKQLIYSLKNVIFVETGCVFMTDDRRYYGEILTTRSKIDTFLKYLNDYKYTEVEFKTKSKTYIVKYVNQGLVESLYYICMMASMGL